jgi:hypothetical protein
MALALAVRPEKIQINKQPPAQGAAHAANVVSGVVRGTAHIWAQRNGVACDLTFTQFYPDAARVYVVPANRYPATQKEVLCSLYVDEAVFNKVERFYSCSDFAKRTRKK